MNVYGLVNTSLTLNWTIDIEIKSVYNKCAHKVLLKSKRTAYNNNILLESVILSTINNKMATAASKIVDAMVWYTMRCLVTHTSYTYTPAWQIIL